MEAPGNEQITISNPTGDRAGVASAGVSIATELNAGAVRNVSVGSEGECETREATISRRLAAVNERLKRWTVAGCWRLQGRVRNNRQALYAGTAGLRMLAFHQTQPRELLRFKKIVEWCMDRFSMATPDDADALFSGRYREAHSDRVLITFDDGFGSNFAAAEWLARRGVRAMFFVVPSLIGRSLPEYAEFHRRNGVEAFIMGRGEGGLVARQIGEMVAMGHRIAAHNFAHRDLGRLHDARDIQYEIVRALVGVEELTGQPCRDFAFAFGQPDNISDEAADCLRSHCRGVYCCSRGLNVPGRTPRFALRHDCKDVHPMAFTRLCIEGGADHHVADRAKRMCERVGVLPPSIPGQAS